jgi:hypothetical protein
VSDVKRSYCRGETGDHRTLADSHRAIVHRRSPVVLAAFAAFAVLCSGCGRTAPTGTVSLPGLENELSLVTHQRLLKQGFDYTTKVTCTPTGTLSFSCDILVTNPPRNHHVEWTEAVGCRPKPPADGLPRCFASRGEALQ